MNSNVMSIKVAASKRSENVNTMPKFLQDALDEIRFVKGNLLGAYNRMYFGEDVDNDYKTFSKAYFDGSGNLINHYYRVQKETEPDAEIEYEVDEFGEYVLEECTLFKWYKLLSDVQDKEDAHAAAVQLLIDTYKNQTDSSISEFEQAVNQVVADNLLALLDAEEAHKLELQTMFEGLTAETTGAVYQAKTNSINEIVSVKAASTAEIISTKQDILDTINANKTEALESISTSRDEVLNTISALGTEFLNTIEASKTNALDAISDAEASTLSNITLSKDEAVQYVVEEVGNQCDSALAIANQAVAEATEASDSITQAVSIIQSATIGLIWSDFTENDWLEDGDRFYCLISDIAAPTAVFELVDDVREYRFGVDIKVDSVGQTILYSSNKFDGSVLGAQYLMDGTFEDEDDNEFTDEELAAMVITDWDDVETNGGEIVTI